LAHSGSFWFILAHSGSLWLILRFSTTGARIPFNIEKREEIAMYNI